jgi:hypothetical protein
MRVSRRRANKAVWAGIGPLALAALVATAPLRSAHAYVDPNAAGPLYQLLFPLLVAIASGLAMLRRVIGRLWNRLAGTVMTAIRREGSRPDVEGPERR